MRGTANLTEKPVAIAVTGEDPVTTILLNGYSIKVPSQYLPLSLYRNTVTMELFGSQRSNTVTPACPTPPILKAPGNILEEGLVRL